MKYTLTCLTAFAVIGSGPATAAAEGDKAIVGYHYPLEANFAMYSDDSDIAADSGCYETLVRVAPNFQLEPSLAVAWTRTSPTTWDFTLRPNVTFQNDTPLTAVEAANALNHLLAEPVPTRAFNKEHIASVEATGPMTLTITTLQPDVMLPGRLTGATTSILAPAAYAGPTINPIGTCTGPFEIVAYGAQSGIETKAYPEYWGGTPKLAGTQLRFVPDSNTRSMMARSGEAAISILLAPSQVSQLERDPSLVIHKINAARVTELLLNNSRPPFDDVRVRQAIKLAIDAEAISQFVYEGYAPPASSPFRQGEPWSPANAPVVKADLDKARSLLSEAGIAPGDLKPTLLVYNSKTELRLVAEVIQAMLAEIGIEMQVRLSEYGAIEADMLSGNYDMAMMSRGYLVDVPEPLGYLSADYSCNGSFNISQFCDPGFDARLTKIAGETDPAKRNAEYAELAQIIYDKAVSVYIVNETTFNAVSKDIEGYVSHPLDYYYFNPTMTLH